ncbi:MAG: hypothetical protein ABS948_00830 [Solibacillus sp.]
MKPNRVDGYGIIGAETVAYSSGASRKEIGKVSIYTGFNEAGLRRDLEWL